MPMRFQIPGVWLRFQAWRQRRHWADLHLEWLRTMVHGDARWLAVNPIARSITERYEAALAEDWHARDHEEVQHLRTRLGMDPRKTGVALPPHRSAVRWTLETLRSEGFYSDGNPDRDRHGFTVYAVVDLDGRVLFDSLNRDVGVTEVHEGGQVDEHGSIHAWDELGRRDMQLASLAPEMLDALERAAEWLRGWASATPYLDELEAVIQKAGGGKR